MTSHSQPVGAPEHFVESGGIAAGRKSLWWQQIEATPRESTVLWASLAGNRVIIPEEEFKRLKELEATHYHMPQGIAEAIDTLRCGPEMWMNKHTHCREEDWEGFQEKAYKIADMLESSLQRLALMDSQLPRVWTAKTIGDAPEGQYWCFSPPYKNQKGYWNVFPFTLNQETKWNVIEGVYPKVHGPLPVPPIEGQVR